MPRSRAPIHVPKFSSRPVPSPTSTTPPTTHPPTIRPRATPPSTEGDDVTIVTALLDIGRGDWDRYRRPLEQYHIFMENLLSLQNNMVIFTDTSSYSFIHKYRKNIGEIHRTKVSIYRR
ncbi:unnamed protein product [Heligmosomoides polygyrus]|uniref:Uncharacterized protein n=1 Tax=Heligmosomoides polygyrus TaxID=6339 RepID=A0A3P7Y731_HELPZ|nr:unnamed protein product [Heligmosomoides polygyrus]